MSLRSLPCLKTNFSVDVLKSLVFHAQMKWIPGNSGYELFRPESRNKGAQLRQMPYAASGLVGMCARRKQHIRALRDDVQIEHALQGRQERFDIVDCE